MQKCQIGMTTAPDRRREEWEREHPTLHGWEILGEYPTKTAAQAAETKFARLENCDHRAGGAGPEYGNWSVYKFYYWAADDSSEVCYGQVDGVFQGASAHSYSPGAEKFMLAFSKLSLEEKKDMLAPGKRKFSPEAARALLAPVKRNPSLDAAALARLYGTRS